MEPDVKSDCKNEHNSRAEKNFPDQDRSPTAEGCTVLSARIFIKYMASGASVDFTSSATSIEAVVRGEVSRLGWRPAACFPIFCVWYNPNRESGR